MALTCQYRLSHYSTLSVVPAFLPEHKSKNCLHDITEVGISCLDKLTRHIKGETIHAIAHNLGWATTYREDQHGPVSAHHFLL